MWAIGFVSEKGGQGKSSCALNVSACAGLKGLRVLACDADPQGNGSFVWLGGEKPRQPTLAEVLLGQASIVDAIVPSHFKNVDVLPADASLADAVADLMDEMGRERRLRAALEDVADTYDVAIVDSSPTRSILVVNVMNAVDEIVVPFTPGLFGALGLGQLQADVAAVRRFLDNKRLRIGGIVLNAVEKNNVHRDIEEQLVAGYGPLVLGARIPKSIKVEEAHARHASVVSYAPKSAAATAFLALTEELLAHASDRAKDGDGSAAGNPHAHDAA